MIRTLLLVLAVPAGLLVVTGSPAALPASALPASPEPSTAWTDPVDSARAELAAGRHWHAARILAAVDEARSLAPEERLLLARAEAGYFNWDGVERTLEGAEWLDRVDGGEGWGLLARARAARASWPAAAEAWEAFLATPAAGDAREETAALVGLVRALEATSRTAEAEARLDALGVDRWGARPWVALEMAQSRAEVGDTAAFGRLWEMVGVDPAARARGWDLPGRVRLEAGDSAGAEAAWREALPGLREGSDRGRAWAWIASLRTAAGDTAAAVEAWREALDAAPRTPAGAGAASRLLALDALGEERALAAARALTAAGNPGAALRAFERYRPAGAAGEAAREGWDPAIRYERARLLARAGRTDEAIGEYRSLSDGGGPGDRALGARILEAWADLRRAQGRTGDVATLREWLLERYPESPEAVDVVFFRGDAAHDRGQLGEAARAYRVIQAMNPVLDRAGLARMRLAQIHLREGEPERALEVYRGYLEDFPDGRRWDEATWWAGRILLETGDEVGRAEGRRLIRGLLERDPLSYYAVLGSDLLGIPYRIPGSELEPPLPRLPWMEEGLVRLDVLERAGLDDGAEAELDRLADRARQGPPAHLLALATELVSRGRTLEAIRMGWELREGGAPWTGPLLRVVYPFPHREMVLRSARERGLDPGLVAALVRQESAFDVDIVSSAGAVGLMQVMPPTGRQLAREEGPRDFSVRSLETPEVNLHLGTRFLRDMWERYDGRLPLVLSAYNAGPSRASRWRSFPEAADPWRFTERIPFAETRGYVKLVTRNAALYRTLHGPLDPPVEVDAAPAAGDGANAPAGRLDGPSRPRLE